MKNACQRVSTSFHGKVRQLANPAKTKAIPYCALVCFAFTQITDGGRLVAQMPDAAKQNQRADNTVVAKEALLAEPAVITARSQLAAVGLDVDVNKYARSVHGDTTIRILGLADLDPSREPKFPAPTPFAVFVLDRGGSVENVQTLSIERMQDGPALLIDSTPADHPDMSVQFRISRVYSLPRIELTTIDHLTGQRVFLGTVEADPSGGLQYLLNPGCFKDCVNEFLSELGFWSAIGFTCCVIGAGIVGIIGGAATLGAAAALLFPIIVGCLEGTGIVGGAATVGAVAGCFASCIF